MRQKRNRFWLSPPTFPAARLQQDPVQSPTCVLWLYHNCALKWWCCISSALKKSICSIDMLEEYFWLILYLVGVFYKGHSFFYFSLSSSQLPFNELSFFSFKSNSPNTCWSRRPCRRRGLVPVLLFFFFFFVGGRRASQKLSLFSSTASSYLPWSAEHRAILCPASCGFTALLTLSHLLYQAQIVPWSECI